MANELQMYQLFKNILVQSKVIEGRFHVLSTHADVNTANFMELIRDEFNGLINPKKYPCAVLLPPVEVGIVDDKGWSTLNCTMYFLTADERTGDGDFKNVDYELNISKHTKEQDWNDMRRVAGEFRRVVLELTRRPPLSNLIRTNPKSPDNFYRVSNKANDNLNGIQLSFSMQLYGNICTYEDYDDISAIVIPDLTTNPHPLHKL